VERVEAFAMTGRTILCRSTFGLQTLEYLSHPFVEESRPRKEGIVTQQCQHAWSVGNDGTRGSDRSVTTASSQVIHPRTFTKSNPTPRATHMNTEHFRDALGSTGRSGTGVCTYLPS
jgi:hypothetical protein